MTSNAVTDSILLDKLRVFVLTDPRYELEMRFTTRLQPELYLANQPAGYTKPLQYQFAPINDQSVFMSAIDYMTSTLNWNSDYSETIDTLYPNHIRHTKVVADNDNDKWVKKCSVRFYDFWEFGIRVMLSLEDRLTVVPQEMSASLIRHKYRTSFRHPQYPHFRYDFNRVVSQDFLRKNGIREQFEIELEFTGNQLNTQRMMDSATVVNQLNHAALNLLKFLRGSHQSSITTPPLPPPPPTPPNSPPHPHVVFIGAQPETVQD
ncbi:UNVERIFIED_CONTAM: hypothetical protein HDU68_006448, partial [Siphonaria sp. JEL0065]